MSPGPINLVPAEHRALELSVSAIVAVLLVTMALWLAGWRWLVAHESGDRLRDELARVASKGPLDRQARPAPASEALPSARQLGAITAAVRSLNTPWRDLFDMVEAATPTTIDLIALDPDATTGQLALTAEAGSPEDMLAYVRRLKREDLNTSARLVGHETVEGVGGVSRLRFRVTVVWRVAPGGSP